MKQYIQDGQLVKPIEVIVPSRVSLADNPSDLLAQAEEKKLEKGGPRVFFPADGAVLSMPVWSLTARVALMPSDHCDIIYPKIRYQNIRHMYKDLRMRGVGDWENIAHQTVLTVGSMLEELGLEYTTVPFLIELDTNIPRQRGVSGSSGMILALMQALLILHDVDDQFSILEKAKHVLSVETALGFSAGMQDRILQSAALHNHDIGAVFMDFSRQLRPECRFEAIEVKMPPMALVLSSQPSHSSEVHEPIINRLIAQDRELISDFHELGCYATCASDDVHKQDWQMLGRWMTMTAEMRVKIYGQEALGPVNMALVHACAAAKCAGNFSGSGGAYVVMYDPEDSDCLEQVVKSHGEFDIYWL